MCGSHKERVLEYVDEMMAGGVLIVIVGFCLSRGMAGGII